MQKPSPRNIASQTPVFEALLSLSEKFAALPAPYATVHTDNHFTLQLETPAAFEAWRVALKVPPLGVELKTCGETVWLATASVHLGVVVRLTGFGVPLSADVALAGSESVAA